LAVRAGERRRPIRIERLAVCSTPEGWQNYPLFRVWVADAENKGDGVPSIASLSQSVYVNWKAKNDV
jgi:hypothetical protein